MPGFRIGRTFPIGVIKDLAVWKGRQQQYTISQERHNEGSLLILIWRQQPLSRVTRELDRGSEDARYYQEVVSPRQLANFRPFNLEEWWAAASAVHKSQQTPLLVPDAKALTAAVVIGWSVSVTL
ncbi:hypothetical protein MSG28_005245 [Choristoneura fumiferana]|uniref:Uncharacterized protein n=1 Tax=Choristoneura fumiferana TaxID=7141 RepID=A0ACC0JQF8_CHOFU|nr:hypothetical protein MSG28_005245 [Choristoneura fumiferana]